MRMNGTDACLEVSDEVIGYELDMVLSVIVVVKPYLSICEVSVLCSGWHLVAIVLGTCLVCILNYRVGLSSCFSCR